MVSGGSVIDISGEANGTCNVTGVLVNYSPAPTPSPSRGGGGGGGGTGSGLGEYTDFDKQKQKEKDEQDEIEDNELIEIVQLTLKHFII